MKSKPTLLSIVALIFIAVSFPTHVFSEGTMSLRRKAQAQLEEGNYRDAYVNYTKLVRDRGNDPLKVGSDLDQAVQCLKHLNSIQDIDELVEYAIKVHSKNWRLLHTAAENYYSAEHHGQIIGDKFTRGGQRWSAGVVNTYARDRVRALQLMKQALDQIPEDEMPSEVSRFIFRFVDMLMGYHGYEGSWRLQYATDLTTLPDYEEGYRHHTRTMGAPVDAEGNPIFYAIPESFDAAASDGERCRWLWDLAVEKNPDARNRALREQAQVLHRQFGVQTMSGSPELFGSDSMEEPEDGPFSVHTLSDDETMAKLATGIKRFKLPEEYNFLKLYHQIAASGKDYAQVSLQALAAIYENRRQYPKAVKIRQELMQSYPESEKRQKEKLKQLTGNLGRFDNTMLQPAGEKASVGFVFRNGNKVRFTAHEVNVQALLDDVRAYLRNKPRDLDWDKIDVNRIGYRLVTKKQERYLGKEVANWEQDLEPLEGHFDRRITVHTPLKKAGAYLLTAEMDKGNKSSIVIWLADTAIVKKPLNGNEMVFIADAVSGQPLEGVTLHLFGYRFENSSRRVVINEYARLSDQDGMVLLDKDANNKRNSWLMSATDNEGRLAFMGFSSIWGGDYYREKHDRTRAFGITDRPVYRPSQTVNFKFWVRRAAYTLGNVSKFAGQSFEVHLNDPQGKSVLTQKITADAYGGMEGKYVLPENAALGVYHIRVAGHSGMSFRVEEYKKPEFEVTVEAPEEPVALGEEIQAKINASYYFGGPVAGAKVSYKVLRSEYTREWFPRGGWDWLYGPGYWWFGYDYHWYPGWEEWGYFRPRWPWWWHGSHMPPEVVAQGEALTDEHGNLNLSIDTALAKELRGNTDHRYEITVEVTDQSRRTIVGKGSVIAARDPFKVYAWVDKGHYRVGDTVQASFSAQTPDGKPLKGMGKAILYKISYKNDQPKEKTVKDWKLDLDEQGRASLKVDASKAGQYRLALKVSDAKGRTREGGYVFTVMGDKDTGKGFVFDHIELVPDKREYAPKDTMRLRINTRAKNSTVVLFERPLNGVYKQPQVLNIKGNSVIHEMKITAGDMPNFFVEAFTIRDGKIHSETRQIVVPPRKRVLNLEVLPSSETYKPGQKAHVDLRLTDHNGEPFVGSTVVTVYDKAVEYISGGSYVGDIRGYFWKWKYNHYPRSESSLGKSGYNLEPSGSIPMKPLGIFGHMAAPQDDANQHGKTEVVYARKAMRSKSGVQMLAERSAPAPAMEMAADGVGMAAGGEGEPEEVEAHVRTEFADTAYWAASLETDEHGNTRVSFDMPENLTAWKIKAWAMGHGTKVGEGSTEVVTSKDLLIRLQAPRFFVEGDEVVLSANIHNYLESDKSVRAVLELDGDFLDILDGAPEKHVSIPANGEHRVDWRVKVLREGEAVIRMKALTDQESDAMEMRFPVYVHGMEKTETYSGVIRPEDNDSSFVIDVPEQRKPEESSLEIRYSPSLAGAMVDALPYLVSYPYGCTEQSLNRFLPTVITLNILEQTGVDLKKLQEAHANLNAQEMGNQQERAEQWRQWKENPVFDRDKVLDLAQEGVDKLTSMQNSDGGWGWFSGRGERSYVHTTATVVRGLIRARDNGVGIVPGVIERGASWLVKHQDEQVELLKNAESKKEPYKTYADNNDAFVYMVLAQATHRNKDMEAFLIRDKNHLSMYGLSLLGMGLHEVGATKDRDRVMKNISQYLICDDENQTCYLDMRNSGYWWFWYGSEFEAHAYYLKLLAAVDPKGKEAPGLVKYILNNRKHASRWNSTRDTALCIEALADYLIASGEDKPDMKVSIYVDGDMKKQVPINASNMFDYDNVFAMEGPDITSGKHEVRIERKGKGPLYYNAWMQNFTLEDFITKAGVEIKVERKVYKLIPVDKTIKDAGARGQVLDRKVEKYEREELDNMAMLKSGDLVEVELIVQSKNDYEYVVFEDFKAAGFEPVEVRSGYNGNAMGAYTEYRDEKVAFFVRSLARGKHSLQYRLRAEIPGMYSALPAKAHAMYAPELKANSDEIKLQVQD